MPVSFPSSLADRTHFVVSPRFELFYALQSLFHPESRLHAAWREDVMARHGAALRDAFGPLAATPHMWPAVPDALAHVPPEAGVDELLAHMADVTPGQWRDALLLGLLHDPAAVADVAAGRLTLAGAIARSQPAKREWLAYVGLYPFDPASPAVTVLEAMVADPAAWRRRLLEGVGMFADKAFRPLWERMAPALTGSADAMERLWLSCGLPAFAERALLRVIVDEGAGVIRAARGGYALPLAEVRALVFMPSLFNERRFWSAYHDDDGATRAYFPCFDPGLAPPRGEGLGVAQATVSAAPAPAIPRDELDPAMVFRALGDATRFAMATIMARTPCTATALAKSLAVSKPTVTHHVQVMRLAGLVTETLRDGSILLGLNHAVIAELSAATLARFAASALPAAPASPRPRARKSGKPSLRRDPPAKPSSTRARAPARQPARSPSTPKSRKPRP